MTREELLKTNNTNAQIVAQFLNEYAERNGWGRIEATQKKIDDCWSYITAQARKQAQNGCAAIRDDVVFNWAVEFYEDVQENKKASKSKKTEVDTTVYEEVKRNAEAREKAKKAKKKGTEEQYEESMFKLFEF